MALIHGLLAKAGSFNRETRRVHVRVLLNEAGTVHDVTLRQSSGNAAVDAYALDQVRQMQFPRARLGAKTSQRYHDLAYEVPADAKLSR